MLHTCARLGVVTSIEKKKIGKNKISISAGDNQDYTMQIINVGLYIMKENDIKLQKSVKKDIQKLEKETNLEVLKNNGY